MKQTMKDIISNQENSNNCLYNHNHNHNVKINGTNFIMHNNRKHINIDTPAKIGSKKEFVFNYFIANKVAFYFFPCLMF